MTNMAARVGDQLALYDMLPLSEPSHMNTVRQSPLEDSTSADPASFSDDRHATQTLAPVDRGHHAWLTLAICFVLEGVLWGKSTK